MARTKQQQRHKKFPPPCSSSSEDDSSSKNSPQQQHEDVNNSSEEEGQSFQTPQADKKLPAAKSPDKDSEKSGSQTDPDPVGPAKRARRNEEIDEVKKPFQRVWGEEDELALLNGAINFKSERNVDPLEDINSFFDFFCGQIGFTKIQIKDKLNRLKKRYFNNQSKNGQFKKIHDQNIYDLAKKIWSIIVEPIKRMDDKTHLTRKRHGFAFNKNSGGVSNLEDVVLSKEGMELIGGSERAAFEERWSDLRVAELELFLKRNQLVADQTRAVLDVYKSLVD